MTKKEFVSLLGEQVRADMEKNRDPCKSHNSAGNT